MKKHIKLLTIGTLLLGGLTGCNDFLDREPLDKVIPEKYFASESDLAAYTINAYPFETVTDAYGINFFGKDNDTDNQASGDSPPSGYPGKRRCRQVKANGTGVKYEPATISLIILYRNSKPALLPAIRIM